jgi:D-beta-D-heptose 7-phosphate kinase/D-beta-D-heptose 1-phosphate adenosyltransferase
LSPEAPVPVVKIHNEYSVPGMAANVLSNLTALGIKVNFITNNQSITKTRYIDNRSGQHLLRVDSEQEIMSWDKTIPFADNNYDAIVISDYNKGFLTYEDIEFIITNASCPVFIDTKKTDLERFDADNVYIKINETEFKLRKSVNTKLIVTLGNQGAMLKAGEDEKIFPTRKVDVVDVCGCGDTFLSALTFEFLNSDNIDRAIVFANKAASLTVQHQGNYAPSIKEITHA